MSNDPAARRVVVDELLRRYFAGENTSHLRAKALDQLVWRGYGAPGVEVGARFARRVDLPTAGVHRGAGFRIWKFKLVAIDAQLSDGVELSRSNADRILRSVLVAEWVRKSNDYRCQFCGQRNDTPSGPYAEAVRIRPVGGGHSGPDVVENALCLCPTHHKLFDLGAFVIDDDRVMIDVMKRRPLGPLIETPPHRIDIEHAAYHRKLHPVD